MDNGQINSSLIDPQKFGLSYASNEELKGGDLSTNTQILSSLLKGQGSKPQREVVALNTALVLWVSNTESDLAKGVEMALRKLESGSSWRKLEELKNFLESSSTF